MGHLLDLNFCPRQVGVSYQENAHYRGGGLFHSKTLMNCDPYLPEAVPPQATSDRFKLARDIEYIWIISERLFQILTP